MGAETKVLAFPTTRKRAYPSGSLEPGCEWPANLVILHLNRPAPRPADESPPPIPADYMLQAILGALTFEQRAWVELMCAEWADRHPKSGGLYWAWRRTKAALDRWPDQSRDLV